MTALTTANLPAFLQLREEYRDLAYDDKNPNKVLVLGDVVEGTLTYGYGTITRPDGSPLQIGDRITHQEALDRLNQYIREEVEPALENLVHVELTGAQWDALGSLIYNFGAAQMENWRLIRRINAGEPPENIAIEWLTDTFTSKGEPMLGLYRRRIMEVLMFFGLDWRAGAAVSWSNSVMEVLESMGWDGTQPKPGPAHDPEIFEPELPPVGTDPTPETGWTMDDRQYDGARAGGYSGSYADFMSHRKVVTERNKIEAPKVETTNEPKPVEDSETGRGYAKEVSGRDDAWIGGIIAGASTAATSASGISKDVRTVTENTTTVVGGATLHQLMLIGMVIGGSLLIYGLWKAFRGEQIKKKGRAEATRLKV